jgi:hypothetical protein
MIEFEVITPMKRWENLAVLRPHLEQAMNGWAAHWTLLVDREDLLAGKTDDIAPHTVFGVEKKRDPQLNRMSPALNQFYHSGLVRDHVYYVLLCDDDFLGPDYFRMVANAAPGPQHKLLVTAMERGDHVTPNPGYGTYTLWPARENMKPGQVSGEQLVMRGDLLRTVTLNERLLEGGEGVLSEQLAAQLHDGEILWVPQASVWFNYLEPGRWDKPRPCFIFKTAR